MYWMQEKVEEKEESNTGMYKSHMSHTCSFHHLDPEAFTHTGTYQQDQTKILCLETPFFEAELFLQ